MLTIPTSVTNDGPHQVPANRWARELSRLMAPVTITFVSIGTSPKWKQAAHLSRLEAVDRLYQERITRVRKMQRKIYRKAAELGCPSSPGQASGGVADTSWYGLRPPTPQVGDRQNRKPASADEGCAMAARPTMGMRSTTRFDNQIEWCLGCPVHGTEARRSQHLLELPCPGLSAEIMHHDTYFFLKFFANPPRIQRIISLFVKPYR